MKNLFLILVIIFILPFQLIAKDDCDKLPKPMPGKLVNDFYNAITDDVESRMEELLRKFNDSTSIEIAVVTIEDIGDHAGVDYANAIGNCWGVGKFKYDNGIILLVSFKGERSWGIATGKGIEQYLTDYKASEIGHEVLIPNLQAGKIDEAFESTINAIIKHLGWKSWEMREYWTGWNNENAALERSYRNKSTARGFGVFFRGLLDFSLLAFIAWCIWRWNLEIRTRRLIKSSIKKWDEGIRAINVPTTDNSWPKWALTKLNSLADELGKSKEDYVEKKYEVLKLMKNHPQEAYDLANEKMTPLYTSITENIPKSISELVNEKSSFEKNSLPKLQEITKFATDTQKSIQEYITKGFLFKDYSAKVEAEINLFESWKKELTKEDPNPDSFKEDYEGAVNSEKRINEIKNEVNLLVSHHDEISSESKKGLDVKIKNLGGEMKEKYRDLLKDMQKQHPETVWNKLEEDFLKVEDNLSEATSNLEKAFEENKALKVTSLEHAYKIYLDAIALIGFVESNYNSIEETKNAQAAAKKEYKELHSSAKSALEDAAEKCESSHVKSSAKDLRDEANDKMKKAEEMLSSGIVDWVWLVALLVSIKEIAKSSYSKASHDISSYDSYQSYSSSSSSSSSSHSDSNFGGFGGGSFGGGGAGGNW